MVACLVGTGIKVSFPISAMILLRSPTFSSVAVYRTFFFRFSERETRVSPLSPVPGAAVSSSVLLGPQTDNRVFILPSLMRRLC